MSRIAKLPVKLPQGVNATIAADAVTVKGAKGTLTLPLAGQLQQVRPRPREAARGDDARRRPRPAQGQLVRNAA